MQSNIHVAAVSGIRVSPVLVGVHQQIRVRLFVDQENQHGKAGGSGQLQLTLSLFPFSEVACTQRIQRQERR